MLDHREAVLGRAELGTGDGAKDGSDLQVLIRPHSVDTSVEPGTVEEQGQPLPRMLVRYGLEELYELRSVNSVLLDVEMVEAPFNRDGGDR